MRRLRSVHQVTLLLDTNAFLWFIEGQDRFSLETLRLIEDTSNEVFVSVVGLWEIAIKVSLKKLELTEAFHALIPREMERNNIELLATKLEHFGKLAQLPFHHRDPFDRLLAAQALVENIPVISSDNFLDAYGVSRTW